MERLIIELSQTPLPIQTTVTAVFENSTPSTCREPYNLTVSGTPNVLITGGPPQSGTTGIVGTTNGIPVQVAYIWDIQIPTPNDFSTEALFTVTCGSSTDVGGVDVIPSSEDTSFVRWGDGSCPLLLNQSDWADYKKCAEHTSAAKFSVSLNPAPTIVDLSTLYLTNNGNNYPWPDTNGPGKVADILEDEVGNPPPLETCHFLGSCVSKFRLDYSQWDILPGNSFEDHVGPHPEAVWYYRGQLSLLPQFMQDKIGVTCLAPPPLPAGGCMYMAEQVMLKKAADSPQYVPYEFHSIGFEIFPDKVRVTRDGVTEERIWP